MELLLLNLYYEKYGSKITYEGVDNFYAYIGYDLDSGEALLELDVQGTSDLMDLLIQTEDQ